MKFLKNLFGNRGVVDADTRTTPDDIPDDVPDDIAVSESPGSKQKKPKQPSKGKASQDKSQEKSKPKPLGPFTLGEDFQELKLPEEIGRAIAQLGFQSCTPVQKEVLPHSLDGEDIIAQAQTGTGKTAAFLLSVLTYHMENPEYEGRASGTPFALVIAPTRELVLQITEDAESLSEFMDFKAMSVVGGMDYEKQKTQLTRHIDLVVATPGRLLDFIRSRVIDLSKVEMLIIDEADRMLSMGFIPDVKSIISRTPKRENRQTQLFSATFSDDIKRLAASWTLNPIHIDIEPETLATDNIDQRVYLTSADQKFTALYNLICSEEVTRIIVFVNRRDETRDIDNKLYRQGIDCGLLSGEVAQKKRIKTLDAFKSGEIKVLVATDVAGRGIHVDGVSHVVNYNLPEDPEDYIHRIGRTGRAGATGISISLACENDAFMLPSIEELLGNAFVCQQVPESLTKPLPAPVRKPRKPQTPVPKRGSRPQRHGRR